MHTGFKVGMQAEALLLGNVAPDQAEGILTTIGVDRWSRSVTPPLRLIAGAGQGPDSACLGLREAVRLRV
eukprot:9274093-Lingulodinium_polyedra.AAC.1